MEASMKAPMWLQTLAWRIRHPLYAASWWLRKAPWSGAIEG